MGSGVVRLEPCPGCSRHVRVSETTCVFCGSVLDFSDLAATPVPLGRLSRGEIMSFRVLARTGIVAVAASGLFPACESDTNPVAIYGAPCTPPSCGVTGGTSGSSATGGSSGSNSTGGTSGTAGEGGEAGLGGEGGS